MIKQIRLNGNHIFLLGIALSMLLLLLNFLHLDDCVFDQNFISPDSYSYIDAANMLFGEFKVHPTRPIGYAFVLGLPNLVLSEVSVKTYIIYSLVLNVFFWLSTIFLLYEILLLFIKRKYSMIVTVLFIFCIGNGIHVFLVLTETIVAFLLVLSSYFLCKYMKISNVNHLILAVSVLNLTILFRPGFLYFSGLLTVSLVFYLLCYGKIRELIRISFVLSFLFVIIQLTSIYKTYGNLTPSYIDSLAWYNYLGAESNATLNGVDYETEKKNRKEKLENLSWSEKRTESKRDLITQIKHNVKNVFIEYVVNIYDNSNAGNNGIVRTRNVIKSKAHATISYRLYKITKYQNILFILLTLFSLGLMLIYRKRVTISILVLMCCILYVIMASGISFYQGDRFHIVLYPLIIVVTIYLLSLNSKMQYWLK